MNPEQCIVSQLFSMLLVKYEMHWPQFVMARGSSSLCFIVFEFGSGSVRRAMTGVSAKVVRKEHGK